ncbi:MAG: cupin domain-containing protein [Gammaproteobacteria bacterium]|nr:cupin domain-containing protein [Gammaproteobacteria bacterium]
MNGLKEPKIVKADSSKEFYTPEGCAILESWNTAADESVSIARARVEPQVRTQLHAVRGIEERYLITQGEGVVEVGELPPTKVHVGDVVVIPANMPQRITNTGDTDLIFYCICTPRFRQDAYENLEQ